MKNNNNNNSNDNNNNIIIIIIRRQRTMNREDEAERRRCVTEAMHLIPLDVDYHDGFVVLTILYDIGWLRSYYRQRKEREQNPEQKFNFRLFDIEY